LEFVITRTEKALAKTRPSKKKQVQQPAYPRNLALWWRRTSTEGEEGATLG